MAAVPFAAGGALINRICCDRCILPAPGTLLNFERVELLPPAWQLAVLLQPLALGILAARVMAARQGHRKWAPSRSPLAATRPSHVVRLTPARRHPAVAPLAAGHCGHQAAGAGGHTPALARATVTSCCWGLQLAPGWPCGCRAYGSSQCRAPPARADAGPRPDRDWRTPSIARDSKALATEGAQHKVGAAAPLALIWLHYMPCCHPHDLPGSDELCSTFSPALWPGYTFVPALMLHISLLQFDFPAWRTTGTDIDS